MSNSQFIRKAELLVANNEGGLDLSQYRVKFNTHSDSAEAPNHAAIRVYNLSKSTAEKIRSGAYGFVVLNAGYQDGNFGTIFKGSVMQVKVGRESNLDTYVDILASDGDAAYNQGVVATSVARESPLNAQLNPIFSAMVELGIGKSVEDMKSKAVYVMNLRGKVLFGLARAKLRNLVQSLDYSWSIQGGEVVVVPYEGYEKGVVVDLSPGTGLIGTPEQTDSGITATSLLNANLKVGALVRILPEAINREYLTKQAPISYDSRSSIRNLTPLAKDATYLVVVSECEGDTRGDAWYSRLIMVGVDVSSETATDKIKGSS